MKMSPEFEEDYRDRLDDVLRSEHRNFAQRLTDWLGLLDSSPESSWVIKNLEKGIDFDSWFQEALKTRRGMVGSGRLNWSSDRTERLGQTLALVRYLAAEEGAGVNFAMSFMYAGSNLNDNVQKVVDQLIEPFGRDLWKHIERENKTQGGRDAAPASDRVVKLDHNSAPYKDAVSKIEDVLKDARSLNSLAAEPEFDRVEAELSAGKRLLEAAAARVEAIKVVLIPPLQWIGKKVGEHALGIAVTALIALIASIFGITIPGI